MSNHAHFILSASEGFILSNIIRDFKKYTANTIIRSIIENPKESKNEWMLKLFKYYGKFNKNNKTYQFWQRDNRPIELDLPKWINQKLACIYLNPVRAGLVDQGEDYIYSSASHYMGTIGILPIVDILTENTDFYLAT